MFIFEYVWSRVSLLQSLKFSAVPLLTAISFGVLCGAPGVVSAKDLRFAFGNADTHPGYIPVERFAERVSKDTGLNIKLYSMSLLSAAQVASGLRDGVADIGWLIHPYHPAKFAESNLIASLSMLATTDNNSEIPGAAMNGATMEYTFHNCPDCLEQFKSQNLVYTSGASTAPYHLLCNKKIATLEDLKGKRIRAGAGNFERWANQFDATGVSMPGGDIYGALSHGVVDCTANGSSELLGYRFIDVTKSITLGVPGGVYSGMAPAIFRRGAWQELTKDQRSAVLKAAAQLAADTVIAWRESENEGMDAARAKGLEIVEASSGLQEATAEFVEQDLAAIEQQFSSQYSVENVAEKVNEIRKLVTKWEGLTKDIGNDSGALAQVYWDEIFSKIDVDSYGMD